MGRCDYFGDELLAPLTYLRRDVAGRRLFPARSAGPERVLWHNLIDHLAGRYRVTKACILRRLRLLHQPAEERRRRAPALAPVLVARAV
jgi:hypothetical protein